MKRDILRLRRVKAIDEITEKLGIDTNSIRRQPDQEHLQLAILEMINDALNNPQDILDRIAEIDGIGEATMRKIKEGLDGS